MSPQPGRVYGDAVARSLGISDVPALQTRSLPGSQVGLTRISCGAAQLGLTPEIPAENSFVVALYLTDLPHHELWSRGRKVLSQGYQRNAMRIVNLEAQFQALIASPHESVCFYIPRGVLDAFADEAEGSRIANLACVPGLVDPIIANLGAALLPAFRKPEQTSPLFLDEITLAFCAHMADRYGTAGTRRLVLPGSLSVGQERRAKEFLAAHFGDTISIADVARTCGLSRGHFLRAFKATTGLTPHKWLQRYRVERAKALLLDPATGIAEIALRCGFADQSHLTRVFTLLVGISPGTWRRNDQGRMAAAD
jgi:AraC family transcriptional regulator